jgi:hypothetical protein
MKLVLTERDLDLLRMCRRAGWLTTRQIQGYYFPGVSVNASQKRLRKLAQASYLFHARPSRTEQSLWRIGRLGLCRLEPEGMSSVELPKRVPGNLQHFLLINDLRLWFGRETQDSPFRLLSFQAEWELKQQSRQLKAIPDALAVIEVAGKVCVFAIEVDLGTEPMSFFQKTKIQNYTFLHAEHTVASRYVLVVVGGRGRLKAIATTSEMDTVDAAT